MRDCTLVIRYKTFQHPTERLFQLFPQPADLFHVLKHNLSLCLCSCNRRSLQTQPGSWRAGRRHRHWCSAGVSVSLNTDLWRGYLTKQTFIYACVCVTCSCFCAWQQRALWQPAALLQATLCRPAEPFSLPSPPPNSVLFVPEGLMCNAAGHVLGSRARGQASTAAAPLHLYNLWLFHRLLSIDSGLIWTHGPCLSSCHFDFGFEFDHVVWDIWHCCRQHDLVWNGACFWLSLSSRWLHTSVTSSSQFLPEEQPATWSFGCVDAATALPGAGKAEGAKWRHAANPKVHHALQLSHLCLARGSGVTGRLWSTSQEKNISLLHCFKWHRRLRKI